MFQINQSFTELEFPPAPQLGYRRDAPSVANSPTPSDIHIHRPSHPKLSPDFACFASHPGKPSVDSLSPPEVAVCTCTSIYVQPAVNGLSPSRQPIGHLTRQLAISFSIKGCTPASADGIGLPVYPSMTEGVQNQERPHSMREKATLGIRSNAGKGGGAGLESGYKASVWHNRHFRLYCSSTRPSTRGGFAAESIVLAKCRLPFTIATSG
ncbi:hypothetical protein LI328DRAFT_124584 [Trichoderma asperelloides]|nr:hypothetical protein LI328DRAFT_124584 [Trichoderma asperelloides]